MSTKTNYRVDVDKEGGGGFRSGGSGWGVRVDVNEELKFSVNSKKKISGGGGSWGRVGVVEGQN